MPQLLKGFSEWLAATPLSTTLQGIEWLVPTVQSLHILAIAALMASASMINLRLIGVGASSQPITRVTERFLPWMWYALIALLLSGSVLIVIEPGRPLTNPVFYAKLSLIACISLITLAVCRPLRADSLFWERTPVRRFTAQGVAVLSWILWVSVICTGRWIAYTLSL